MPALLASGVEGRLLDKGLGQGSHLQRHRMNGRFRPSQAEMAYVASILLAMALGTILRCHGIQREPLNFDEGATLYFARLPVGDLWGEPARLEPNPPLFYAVAHVLVALLGGSATVLRLASVAAGIACIPAAAFVARRLGGPRAGIAAALLVATSAAHVVTSQDARAYSMLTLAALVAIAAEVWLLGAYGRLHPPARHALAAAWACYAVAVTAALYLHNTAVLMLGALNVVALVAWAGMLGFQRRFALHWIAANLAAAGAYAFWVPVVLEQSVHTLADFWLQVPTLRDLRYGTMNAYAQPYATRLQPFVDGVFLLSGLVGLVFHRGNRVVLGLAVGVLAGVPAATWIVSQWRPLMNGKTLLWLVPVFLVFVALGCTYLRRSWIPVVAVLASIQLAACASMFADRPDEAYPEVAEVLRDNAVQGDVMYLYPASNEVLLAYYGWPRDRLTVYAPANPDLWFRHSGATSLAGVGEVGLGGAGRVWILTRSAPSEHRRISERLGITSKPVLHRVFGHGRTRNLELSLYGTRP